MNIYKNGKRNKKHKIAFASARTRVVQHSKFHPSRNWICDQIFVVCFGESSVIYTHRRTHARVTYGIQHAVALKLDKQFNLNHYLLSTQRSKSGRRLCRFWKHTHERKTSTCSVCQTIWTRRLPARDSSGITGLALDKSFL